VMYSTNAQQYQRIYIPNWSRGIKASSRWDL
jgi:hypothetical protein